MRQATWGRSLAATTRQYDGAGRFSASARSTNMPPSVSVRRVLLPGLPFLGAMSGLRLPATPSQAIVHPQHLLGAVAQSSNDSCCCLSVSSQPMR